MKPYATAEGTGDRTVRLLPRPLVETSLVNVVAAGNLTPHDLLIRLGEVATADRAIILYRLAIAIVDLLFGFLCWHLRRSVKDDL